MNVELCEIVQDSSADCGIGCSVHGEEHLKHVCMSPETLDALKHVYAVARNEQYRPIDERSLNVLARIIAGVSA